jgi:PhnB protein
VVIQPYLNFNGRCEEAIEFYKKALGAQVLMMSRFEDMPASDKHMMTPGVEKKVMHASFRIGDSTLMASDGRCQAGTKFEGFSLSITPPDKAAAEKVFSALSDGGQVQMPLGATFFSPCFGMLADRFGVTWMVFVPPKG